MIRRPCGYATGLYCHWHLGRNERLPRFPVGKRLAFDREKGRLWVIGRTCARWNLSPLDERYEANEECESIFRGTRVRVSTDNTGLAEMADRLTLVRIGKPLWPEFAAWRYGRRFSRRRQKSGIALGAIVGGAVGIALSASRLAFETSLQEDGERRALDGELQSLEAAWREAEQIAAIADNLLMPSEVLERLTGLRHGIVRRPGFAIG